MKRIVIFADGTWNSPESGRATNVLKMARAVSPTAGNTKQVCFYDWGVGTDRKRFTGGLSGSGIDKNIQDCYRFLIHNYDTGDKLYLFGFSRGAYTVRSLAGLIRNCGVLKREHADEITNAYRLYRKRTASSKPSAATATKFREDFAVADITEIEFLGVWDTVGSLGVPIPFWGVLGEKEFLFHDLEPSKIIKHARHALSIDENREDFLPSLWEKKDGLDLEQIWFAGVHCDVGGGYRQKGLSDTACQWMIKEATAFGLAFEKHFIDSVEPDHTDRLHDEYKRIYRLREKVVREIDGPLHVSVKKRWDDPDTRYQKQSKAVQQLLAATGGDWSKIEIAD